MNVIYSSFLLVVAEQPPTDESIVVKYALYELFKGVELREMF